MHAGGLCSWHPQIVESGILTCVWLLVQLGNSVVNAFMINAGGSSIWKSRVAQQISLPLVMCWSCVGQILASKMMDEIPQAIFFL